MLNNLGLPQGFTAKPGEAITFAANDGQIDFAIGIYGDHNVWDGASIAANLPIGKWQFFVKRAIYPIFLAESLTLGWGLEQYRFHTFRATPIAAKISQNTIGVIPHASLA